MSRSRLVLFISMSVVVLGVLAGAGALWMGSARAAVGPLPGEGLVLPADTRFVMGLDVKRFAASAFWTRYGSKQPNMRPEAWSWLEQNAGLDPARDIDQIVMAGSATAATRTPPLVLAFGRFDPERIAQSLKSSGRARVREHEGVTIYELTGPTPSGKETQTLAAALLDRTTVAFGPPERVEATVGHRARGEAPLEQNAELLALVAKVRPGATFWMVGDQALLASLPKTISAPGMGGPSDMAASLNLPPLRALTVTGDLDPDVSLAVVGEAADETAATKLADVVRGVVALVSLQARQKPELQQLASAFTVATEANRVLVNARLPYELIDSLQASVKPRAGSGAPAESGEAEAPAAPE